MAERKKVIVINKEDIKKSLDDVRKEFDKAGHSGVSNAELIRLAFEKLSNDTSSDRFKERIRELGKQEGLTAKETEDLRTQVDLLNRANKDITETTEGASMSLSKMLGVLGGTVAVKRFISQMVDVRGEMESMEKSFEVLLGGKKKSDEMVVQLVDYAVATPFRVDELANATQTLLGFNVEAEKVIPLLKQIGDISMGNSQRFQSLNLAFAQMYGAGRLRGQELMQMINAGFNPLQIIAEKTGKTISQLKDEMSKGAISTKMVEQAFKDATAEGGRFNGMMEKNAGTIKNISNQMTGAFEEMFNQLGKNNEGFIKGFYKSGIVVAENYEKIGKILVSLITTYGAYRAALVLATATANGATLAEISRAKALAMVNGAQKMLNATMLANPYVLLTTLAVAYVGSMWALSDSTSVAEKAQKKFNEAQEESNRKLEERKRKTEEMISVANDDTNTTEQRTEALNSLIQKYPDIIQKYIDEKGHLKDIVAFKREIAEIDRQDGIESNKSTVDSLKAQLKEAKERYADVSDPKNMSQMGQGASAVVKGALERVQSLEAELKEANKLVFEDQFTDWSISLKKYSQKQLEEEIKENEKRYKTATEEEKELINRRQNILQVELGLRAPKGSYKQEYDNAQKEWNDAKKALKSIEADKDKFSSEQFKEAKNRAETAEANYKALGGKVEAKTGGEKFSFDEYIQGLSFDARKSATNDRLKQLVIDEEKAIEENKRLGKERNLTTEQSLQAEELIRQRYANQRTLIQEEELKKEQDKQQKEKEALEKSLEAFESYEVQRQSIIDRYAELRKNASEKHDKDLMDKAEKKDLKDLDTKFNPKLQTATLDLTRAKINELVKELNRLRSEIEQESDPKIVQALQERIDQTLSTLQNKSPFVAFSQNIKEAFAGGKVDFEILGNAIEGIVPSLQGIADDTRDLFGDGAGDALDGLVQSIDGLSDLSKSIGAFAEGNVVEGAFGLLSAANKLLGNSIKVNAEHREALRLLKLQKEELQHQIAIAELRAKLETKVGIFGSDSWGQALRNADAYKEALDKIGKAFERNDNQPKIDELEKQRSKSRNGYVITNLTNQINKLKRDQLSEIEKINVVTGSEKSGWGPWRKRKDIWSPITELKEYSQLFDEVSGKVDIKLAQQILNNKKMSDESKASLQHLIDNAQVMEDAMTQITNNLKDIFGELGQTIINAFEESSRSGINDFAKVEEAGSKMIERLAKEMIFSVLLGDLINDYTEKMKVAQISDKDDEGKLLDFKKITEEFIEAGLAQQGKYGELMDMLKNNGINFEDESKQQSTTGVQRSVTQDTAEEINGRATAIQIASEGTFRNTSELLAIAKSNANAVSENMEVLQNITLRGVYHLADIEKNTHVLHAMSKDIQKIEQNFKKL